MGGEPFPIARSPPEQLPVRNGPRAARRRRRRRQKTAIFRRSPRVARLPGGHSPVLGRAPRMIRADGGHPACRISKPFTIRVSRKQPVVKVQRRTEGGEAPRRSTPRRTVRAVGTPAERRDERRAGPPPCVLCTVGCNTGSI